MEKNGDKPKEVQDWEKLEGEKPENIKSSPSFIEKLLIKTPSPKSLVIPKLNLEIMMNS